MRTFLTELRRRRVFRTLALYIVGGWVLIQVAEVAFESWGIAATYLRYVWIGLALAFPAAALFGWRYDITSDGIVRTPPAGADETQDLSLRPMDYGLIAALVLVVAAIGYGVFQEAGEERALVRESERPGIAVLPFVDLTADGDLEYFGAGIAEALLNALGHITEIDVIARTSSFYFQGSNASMTEIADALAVDYLVEGSVNRDGETVHVGAKLIDTGSGRQLWSGTFEGSTGEAFTAQQDIADAVAGFLEMSLGDPRKHGGTTNFQAYESFLRATAQDTIDQTMIHVDEALAHDPDFALAIALKAALHYFSVWQGLAAIEDAWDEAAPLLERALELAPELAGAHVLWGGFQLMRQNREEALASLERALELNPSNTNALVHLSRYYTMEGRHEESIAIAERNVRLDPMVPMRHVQLANRRISAGDIDAGFADFERAIELNPQSIANWQQYIGRTGEVRGPVEALRLFARMQAVEDPPMSMTTHPLLLRQLGLRVGWIGDTARGRALLELARQHSDNQWIPMDLGGMALVEGRFEDGWRETWLAVRGNPSNSMPAAWLVDFAIGRGAGMEEVLAYYRRQWPELFTETPDVAGIDPRFAVAVVRALRHAGDDEQADRVFEATRAYYDDPGWRGQDQESLARILVLAGDYDAALSTLEQHVEDGGELYPRADYAPTVWAPIADHPRFIAVMDGIEEMQAAQRAEVEAMIERGELIIPTADDL